MRIVALVPVSMLGLLLAGPAPAQRDARIVAVPYYRPAEVIAPLYRDRLAPAARDFETQAGALAAALDTFCAAAGQPIGVPREAWRGAVAAWERLSTVSVGPLLERRSARSIDFLPSRPEAIRRAIADAPSDAAAMERIGSAAKGLPAIEWLLWSEPLRAASPACAYAVRAADDVRREAVALAAAFGDAARRDWSEAQADAAFAEWFNQWVGALERLRWQQLERPVREGGSRAALVARRLSGDSAASWARQWRVLREAAVFGGGAAPAAGSAPVPIETFLRGRGLNPLADRWVRSVEHADAAMRGLRPADGTRRLAAAKRLAATKQIAESDVATAVNVQIGFSDADGD